MYVFSLEWIWSRVASPWHPASPLFLGHHWAQFLAYFQVNPISCGEWWLYQQLLYQWNLKLPSSSAPGALRVVEMWLVNHIIIIFIISLATTYLSFYHMPRMVSNILHQATYSLQPSKEVLLWPSCSRWRNLGTDGLSDLPNFTPILRCEARIHNEEIWFQGLCS